MDPFALLKLGSLTIPNRIFMAPVKTGYGVPAGDVTPRHEAYYRKRAEGGAGAIIVEPLFIDPAGKEHPKQIGISAGSHIKELKKLVKVIHDNQAIAIAHINHAGRAANPKASGQAPETPSPLPCPATGATAVEMTTKRVKEVISGYVAAARRAREAGFDALEIQFGLGYLIAQFLSPRTNLRKDKYGSSRENRYRFAAEIIASIKNETSGSLPLIARISATERTDNGLELKQAVKLGNFLKAKGISALHVVSGSACDSPPWYYQHMRLPMGKNLNWAAQIKKETGLPVIAAGRLGAPEDIRRAIGDGLVDAVALGRPLVADPDLPRKLKENRDNEVIECGACLQGCLMKVKSGEGLGCIINPTVGREAEQYVKPTVAKKIVIVGGGPAGMQAALTASERGHQVVLFDKNGLGGQFALSFLPPGKDMMKRPFDSLVNKIKRSPIDLRLNREATVDTILRENPSQVIIATGAEPIMPSLPGLQNPLSGAEVLTEKKEIGKSVLIVGGGMVGLECAEFLADKKHEITVVELLEDVARDMEPVTRKLTLKALSEKGIKIHTKTKLLRFENRKAFVEAGGAEKLLGEYDDVVMAVGTRPVNTLAEPLRNKGLKVQTIGDAGKPGQVYDAIRAGFDVAVAI